MKKLICLLLTLTLAFAFVACQKKGGGSEEETTAADNYRPGAWVTDENGVVQTVRDPIFITDKNGNVVTEVVTDKEGKTQYDVATSYVDSIQTYPAREGETLPSQAPPQSVPVGNTLASQNKTWPSDAFMAALPKAAEKIDFLSTSSSDEGNCVSISVNEFTYEQFTKYLKTLAAAGFTQSYGTQDFPAKAKDGDVYRYGTITNGLYVNVVYYTDKAPNRNCDLRITVADYDVGGINQLLGGQK